MSLNIPPIHVAAVMDPRLEIKPREYVALKGAQTSSWQVFPATSTSTSSVQVTCNPPSRQMAINRIVWQRAAFDITINGTNTGASPLLVDGYHGPRAMPLTMVSNACQVTFGNATVTQSPLQQYWGALMWLGENDFSNRFGQYSLAPSMLDQAQSYDELAQTPRNPLGLYSQNSFENTRRGYVGYEVLTNTSTTATIRLTTLEPILLSPLVSGHGSNFTSCLSGLQNMSYQLNFGDLRRLMSLTPDQGSPGVINILSSGINVTVANFSLIFNYMTPNPLYPLPSSIQSSYFSLVSYPTDFGELKAGDEATIPFNSVQLPCIPRRLIIFARERDMDRSAFTTDTYLSLPRLSNPLSITYDNNQYFNQATAENLYDIAVKNGCQMSYSQYTKHVGSVIILDSGIDFGVGPNEAPGVLKNVQLGMTCRFVNTSERDLNVQMFVIAVYEGVININNGSADLRLGVLSNQDVLDSQRVAGVTYKQQTDVYGGNFFTSLRNALGTAHKFIKENKVLSTALRAFPHPLAQAAGKAAKHYGYGMHGGNLSIENEDDDDEKENESCEYEEYENKELVKHSKKLKSILSKKNRYLVDASELASDNDTE